MPTPESKHAPVSDSPTWADTPTRTDITRQPESESHALKAISARYEVVSELGRGGMGMVLKVRDRETEEIVALKLLHPEIAANKEWEQRFKDELRLARKITHKNVCRVYELLRFDDTAAIAMEFVEGETLRQVMRRFGGLPLHKAIEVVKEICGGLREAHAQGVVHRDLKPENVIIDGTGSVHIMDFGLARSAASMTGSSSESRRITGTPEYMSPEQASGKHADARSDIYALGLILYEVLTRRAPFQADSAMAVALKHINEAPPAPRQIDPTIPHYVERTILRCLEKNPSKRFQTVEELEEALTSKQQIKEMASAEEEPEDVPLPLHLARWQRSDYKLAGLSVVALVIFFAIFARVTPFASARFLPGGEAQRAAKQSLEQLGFVVEPTGAHPVENVSLYTWLAYRGDRSLARQILDRRATGWTFFYDDPFPQVRRAVIAQDGSLVHVTMPQAPSWMQANMSDAELQSRLSSLLFQVTHEDPKKFEMTGTRLSDMYRVSAREPEVPGRPTTSLSAAAGPHGFYLYHSVYSRIAFSASSRWRTHVSPTIFAVVLILAMALFFLRRLQRRPRWMVAITAGLAALLAITSFREPLEDLVASSLLPRFLLYVWQGSSRELSGVASQAAAVFLHVAFAILLFSVLYCAGAAVQYYGQRGDPARFRTLMGFDGATAVIGLAAIRGFLAGSFIATVLTAMIVASELLQWAALDSSWISLASSNSSGWWWFSRMDSAALIGWRTFALAALEALAVVILVGLPAGIVSRISKRTATRIGTIVVFWTAIGFSLSGMTTFGTALAGYSGVLLQAVCLAMVYWRYDLLTAMFSAFSANALVLGYGAYLTFRTFDVSVSLTAIPLMIAVVLVPTLAYYRPPLITMMRRAARVFE